MKTPRRGGDEALLKAARPILESFPRDQPLLVAVSGGRDSMALLHALRRSFGFEELIVCHLDHALREESAADADFVRQYAKELGCAWEGARREVRDEARRLHLSIEAAAREVRFRFLAEVSRARNVPTVALGHHADDRVETVLFNLFRGAGPAGLAAMPAVKRRSVGGTPLTLLRPLLGVWREEIDAFVTEHGIPWREDASNADRAHTRNRLRHEIIPALEGSFGRDIRRSIWRTADLLEADQACLEEWAAQQPLDATLAVAKVVALPLAVQRRVLLGWMRARGVPDADFEAVAALRTLLTAAPTKVNLPGGWHARSNAGAIWLEPPSGSAGPGASAR